MYFTKQIKMYFTKYTKKFILFVLIIIFINLCTFLTSNILAQNTSSEKAKERKRN